MLIFPKNKTVFIAIPKSGSTSIISSVNKDYLQFEPGIYHSKSSETCLLLKNNKKDFLKFIGEEGMSLDDYELILENIKDYRTFAVIRDPIQRIRSYFCEIHEGLHIDHYNLKKLKISQFLDFIIDNDDGSLPLHLLPSYKFLDEISNLQLFLFEDIKILWRILNRYNPNKVALSHERDTRDFKMRGIFNDYVTNSRKLQTRLQRRYSIDFKTHSLLLERKPISNKSAHAIIASKAKKSTRFYNVYVQIIKGFFNRY
tara:strand:+ start:937 stop:1707 length:771 start_codon:yes stop_codon:yes gene_type:complete